MNAVSIIPNGIDVRQYVTPVVDPLWRSVHGLPDRCLLIGAIGRIHPGKGQELFLEAAYKVMRATSRDVHFLIVGQEFKTELENLRFTEHLLIEADRLGIADRFHLMGFQNDIHSVYANLDIVALPTYEETFGMVILEAMAHGKAVVATKTGGIPELIENEMNGCLVSVGDFNGLARILIRLIEDEQLRIRLGTNARQFALSNYDVRDSVTKLEKIYASLLS